MTSARNPMRRTWLDDYDGGFVPHRMGLIMSPAWHLRPKTLGKILERLEIEHLRHGGKENGNLTVSYEQFVDYGISKKGIRQALDIGVALGLL